MSELLTVDDHEAAAQALLSPMAYDYFRGGADDERALRASRAAFDRYQVWYRVLVDVSKVELRTTVLGSEVAFPIGVAPLAAQRLAHPDGERATARGAAEAGALFVEPTLATVSLEEVAATVPPGPRWFQLYAHKDRGLVVALVERARRAGYRALVVTVDTPVLGRRLRDERNGFQLPPGMTYANLVEGALAASPRVGACDGGDGSRDGAGRGSDLAAWFAARHDPSLTFADLSSLRALAGDALPIVVKGIVRADDARRAVDAGAAAILVSNHGGRQLDLAPAPLDALPAVVDAVAGRAEVYLDGGIRGGGDALLGLALGARAVFVGRPVLWALATDGAAGVRRLLLGLRDELARAMALAGAPSLAALDRDLVRPSPAQR